MRIFDFEDFAVDLEYNSVFVIAHLPRVENFTKTLLQKLLRYTEQLYDFITVQGYENLFAAVPEDSKENKLLDKLGFVYLGNQDNLNVYVYKEFKDIEI